MYKKPRACKVIIPLPLRLLSSLSSFTISIDLAQLELTEAIWKYLKQQQLTVTLVYFRLT